MANLLVTGGAGFIGSHLVTKLVEQGHRVRVLDNLSTGHAKNLNHLSNRFEMIEGDICDIDQCQQACKDIEIIFHEAALGSVPKSVDEPMPSHDTNCGGTFHILKAAVDQKVRRFIYAASSSAYGNSEVSPKHEKLLPLPMSPYAVQKLTGEFYCKAFYECYGLETMSLRYFNVFGDRQDPNSLYAAAIPAFVVAILHHQPPTIYGDGNQSRDFTHIQNVVDANMLAMNVKHAHGESINVACGDAITINQVIASINRLLTEDVKPNYVEPRAGDVLHSCADITLAKKILGYSPDLSFEEGLKRTIEYYKSLG